MYRRILNHLNPISHLGDKDYSFHLALLIPLITATILEVVANEILNNPYSVGIFAIILFIPQIIYFAFRFGIRGGVITALITIFYYSYIVISRNAPPDEQTSQWRTISALGLIYLAIAYVIGWLKETIDNSLENESNERRRLQAIVEQLPTGILVTNEKGEVVQGNSQAEKILGRKIRKGLIAGRDTHPTGRVNGRTIKPTDWPLAQVVAGKKPPQGKIYSIINENDKVTYLQISATEIKNTKGKMIAAVSIINDITEQKEMETRKDDFINMASHELKTPITSMKLYLESLRKNIERNRNERAIQVLDKVKQQTDRLQELASDLLDVSRLQTGKLSFSKEKFRLDTLIEDTVKELQDTTKDQPITIEKNPPLLVFADKFRIYQVLTNLITNASKYSPAGENIAVSLKREKDKAIISVRDFGIGIRKDQQKKIFDRLYQVTDPTEKTFPGLGMGLYISKQIVIRHKGKIWVESEKDKGSTFYFSLPATKR